MLHDLVLGVGGVLVLAVLMILAVQWLLTGRTGARARDAERATTDRFAEVVADWNLDATTGPHGAADSAPPGGRRPDAVRDGSDAATPSGGADMLPGPDGRPACPHRARAGEAFGDCEQCARSR